MPEQDITLRKLEIFLGYMDTMNISKTAEIMHISPVSVHRALHSLEDNLRCDLFHTQWPEFTSPPGAWVMQKAGPRGDQQCNGTLYLSDA